MSERYSYITLLFSAQPRLELIRICVTLTSGRTVIAVRGKSNRIHSVGGSFQWTAAVKALALLLLRTKLYGIEEGAMSGGRGSLPAALDFAVGKPPRWLTELFGEAALPVGRLFRRHNPELKQPGVTTIGFNSWSITPEMIVVKVEGHTIDSLDTLAAMARHLAETSASVHPEMYGADAFAAAFELPETESAAPPADGMLVKTVDLQGRSFGLQFGQVVAEFGREIPWLNPIRHLAYSTNPTYVRDTLLRHFKADCDDEIVPYQLVSSDESREFLGGILHLKRSPESFLDRRNQDIFEQLRHEEYGYVTCLQLREVKRGADNGRALMRKAFDAILAVQPKIWAVASRRELVAWYQTFGGVLRNPVKNKDGLYILTFERSAQSASEGSELANPQRAA